ncbi:MAG: CHC2 zinc finger domain-containing protein, partial [Planctomycetota bacterium]
MSLEDLQQAKEQVRQAIDIVDLVGGYLSLRRQGRIYVATCPWHDDARPSLQVNPERQSWKCWVCNIGGDIFSYVMRAEGLEFREALEMLADRAGVTLQRSTNRAPATESQFERRNLLRVMEWAEREFHAALLTRPDAESARRYLAERDVSEQSIERFSLGFSPRDWQWLLERGAQAGWS